MYPWLFMSAFFSALTIISIKYHFIYPGHYILLVTILSEIGLIYSYIQLLQTKNILVGFSLVKILSILIVLFFSVWLFHVKLTNRQIFGMLLALISLYLLE